MPASSVASGRIVVQAKGLREVHPLGDAPITVGRAPDNTVVLADPRVSRFHVRIERHGDGLRVVDRGSQNGTFKNGRRIQSAPLAQGDVVQVGGVRLVYEPDEHDGSDTAATTTHVPLGQSEGTAPLDRLSAINRALNSATSDEQLFRLIIDASVELTGSERGFLIRKAKEGMEFAAARNLEREDLQKPEFELSWSIAIRVGTRGRSVLAVNAAEDERFRSLESVEALGLRSVLCVPIDGPGGILGVIYVDNLLREGAYAERDRQLLEGLADQAGIVMNNRRLIAELKQRSEEVESLNERLRAQVEEKDSELARIRTGEAGGGEADGYRDFRVLIGGSARMEEVRHLLRKVAATDFPVLIQGESGTGKELVARCVHSASARARRPFISVNCAAIPETLLENELFGHARGAFTGADQKQKGLFQAADGGSLFMDEVSEMSTAMQSRLLRVLQEGEVRPVGAKETLQVDVRIIAASNRDLAAMVDKGAFRQDLYYRLKVLPVTVPPLRQRREDIPDLVTHFFRGHNDGVVPVLEPEALDVLCSYAWPGNVRELENEVKRLAVLAGDVVERSAISRHILEAGEMLVGRESSFQDLNELVESIETREIQKALARTSGNKTRAASLLGISRFTLQRKLEKYGLAAEAE